MEAAINPNPDLPGFIRQFQPAFPVGLSDHGSAMSFMQLSPVVRSFVPFLVIIDGTGTIRAQYTGSDPFLSDEAAMDKNIRAEILKLLSGNGQSSHQPGRKPNRARKQASPEP